MLNWLIAIWIAFNVSLMVTPCVILMLDWLADRLRKY